MLIESQKEIFIKDLSKNLQVSDRTIRYDIESINDSLNEYDLNLIEKMSKGLLKFDIKSLKFLLDSSYQKADFFYEEYREELILIQIAFEEKININELADKFLLSRSTIKIILRNIDSILNNYDLKLTLNPQKGLKIVGEEESIRKLQLKILNQCEFNSNHQSSDKDFLRKLLHNYFLEIDINRIKVFINYILNSLNKIISDEAYNILINYSFIMIKRIKEGKNLLSVKNSNFFSNTLEYNTINRATPLLEVSENIKINKNEIIKFTDYLLGSHSYNTTFSSYENWIEIEILIKKIIILFSNLINVDLQNDTILLEGLVNHIKPTVYRIKNKIELENSITKEFLEFDYKLFETTKKSLYILKDFLGEEIPDSEVAFIGVYFKSALDRNINIKKEVKNIIIVCGSGYGTSKLIAQQIKNRYNVNIVDTIPMNQLEKYLYQKNIDVIVTNIKGLNREEIKIPTIFVKTILTSEDFEKFDKFNFPKYTSTVPFSTVLDCIKKGAEVYDEKKILNELLNNFKHLIIDDTKTESKNLSFYLKEKTILLNQNAIDWKDALKKAGDILIENNFVYPSYTEGMINSVIKNGSYIVIDNLVALPHAKNDNNILQTGMGLITFSSEINFPEDTKVKYILAFCSADNNSHLNAIIQFVDLIKKYNFTNVLENTTSKKKIVETIKKYEFLSQLGKK